MCAPVSNGQRVVHHVRKEVGSSNFTIIDAGVISYKFNVITSVEACPCCYVQLV